LRRRRTGKRGECAALALSGRRPRECPLPPIVQVPQPRHLQPPIDEPRERKPMKHYIMASLLALSAAQFAGCAVTDGQSTLGQYTDDTAITTQVKAKMAEDPAVSASRISVETLNGTVQLSGFATTQAEKDKAETVARSVSHVKQVRNNIVVKPAS
jgi:hypothetical protein